MSFQFYCPNCGASFTVRDEWAGRSATCKKCHQKLTIPSEQVAHPPRDILVHRQKKDTEKYCSNCGEIINAKAELCPKCGVRQEGMSGVGQTQSISVSVNSPSVSANPPPPAALQRSGGDRSKLVAAILAFFLGGLGIHKFYLGQRGRGMTYLLFFWTGIPALVALFEAIVYLCQSRENFDRLYNR